MSTIIGSESDLELANKCADYLTSSKLAKRNGKEPKIAKTVQKNTVIMNPSLVLKSPFLFLPKKYIKNPIKNVKKPV